MMERSLDVNEIIPFSPPTVGVSEIQNVLETLESNWLTTGPKTRQFEQEFAARVQAPAALALNSCTSGLHLALVAHEIGPGDEVITTTMTFASTVNVIEHVGATPILVDVQPDTLNLGPENVEAAITSKTKAIVVVHYAGHPADIESITEIAERHGLIVIEDAAHALPAANEGQMVGSRENLTSFSFYATKNLTTAEGGMLTGASDLIERARALSLHGMSRNAWKRYGSKGSWQYDVVAPGFKCNMTDLQAALGLAQLQKLDWMQARRLVVFESYDRAFGSLPAFEIPTRRSNVAHALHLYVLRLNQQHSALDRDSLIEELKARGICTSVHFIPIHMHSYYREKYRFNPEDFPIAYDSYQRMLSLPLSPALNDDQLRRVIKSVCELGEKSFKQAS